MEKNPPTNSLTFHKALRKKALYLFCVLAAGYCSLSTGRSQPPAKAQAPTLKEYIFQHIPKKKEIDVFLNDKLTWARFDPELGYTLNNFIPKDGVDNSATISSVGSNGARTAFLYTDKPCRINTYGNSFTQCHQVGDGETWQEYLAAHLGEPIRNFGMGGHGVYQAYRRMVREEQSKHSAEHVIFYIWGDDHTRSMLRCRYMLINEWNQTMTEREGIGKMFHNNFWANIEMDLESGQLVEKKNRIPNAKDLYRMTDPQWMYDNLKDDLAMQMLLFMGGKTRDFDTTALVRLAAILDHPFDPNNAEQLKRSMWRLLNTYSFEVTKYILEKVREFTDARQKKLMVVLFDPSVMFSLAKGSPRYEQAIVDFLQEKKFLYFDMNQEHLRYYQDFRISFEEYWKRYSIGHYNPTGNHFFAFSIKPKIVEWLHPKPITYKDAAEQMINFRDYLDR